MGYQAQNLGTNSVTIGSNAYTFGVNNITMGQLSRTQADDAVVMGQYATTSDDSSVVIGDSAVCDAAMGVMIGAKTQIGGDYSTVVGPYAASSGFGSVALGYNSAVLADTGITIGYNAFNLFAEDGIAIGDNAQVYGNNSLALGAQAVANNTNSYVFGNGAVVAYGFGMEADQTSSTMQVLTPTGAIATMDRNGTWSTTSDVNRKENFESIDLDSILTKISAMPITQWNYKGDPAGVRHIGPMAQDFYKTFHVGANDKTISTVDPAGITLAGVQGLYKKLLEDEQKIKDMQAALDKAQAQQSQIDALTQKLAEMEKKMDNTSANH
jgi:hypothetical protein